jgi:hypothetical protein
MAIKRSFLLNTIRMQRPGGLARILTLAMALALALFLAGCGSAQQPAAAVDDKAAAEAAAATDEARDLAEASLGKGAEVLARGDLALNGSEQLLVANRFSKAAAENNANASAGAVFVTRAAVLQKNDGQWSQVLVCDEHLKNPRGYLGNSGAARVSGWRLEYSQDAKNGLEMKFTPADLSSSADAHTDEHSSPKNATFDVRWNKSAERYESYDPSHERFLSEVPSLEAPESTLK